MHLDQDVLTALVKAPAGEEKTRSKGVAPKNKPGRKSKQIPNEKSDDASGADAESP